ncbi:hypothetical protein [Burkholderia ambifaria]|uniref:hypothetical protein n=1 Tax=Burkholderia ambifaria TaxID=152480 RepID=UPI000B04BE4B|nr:hypothetical protein [Burkholderia ambifaria]
MPHNDGAIEEERIERVFRSTVAFYPRARNIASAERMLTTRARCRFRGAALFARAGLRAMALDGFSHNRVPLRVPMAGSRRRLPLREIVHMFAGHDRAGPETQIRVSIAA